MILVIIHAQTDRHTPITRMDICRKTNNGRFAIDCRKIRELIRYALLAIATHSVKAATVAALQTITNTTHDKKYTHAHTYLR